jgi:tRNA pseudouridine38-40 synthase
MSPHARYFLEVSYDGTAFHGSQLQGETPTVQKAINDALATLFRTPVDTFGASRTDEGVHALSNFYHFDAPAPLSPSFQYQINAILPDALALQKLHRSLAPDFNARFGAVSRRYRYRIYHRKNPFSRGRAHYFPYRIKEETLHEMAAVLLTYTDFTSFAKRNAQTRTNLCSVDTARWERVAGREDSVDELHFVVEANRFLRGMVRGLVGTQLVLARRGLGAAALREILDAQDCTKARFDVPGFGLYLEEVRYPSGTLEPVFDSRRHD